MKRGADLPRLLIEVVRITLMCRGSNQSTLYARTVNTILAHLRSFSHFYQQVKYNASLFFRKCMFLRTWFKYTKKLIKGSISVAFLYNYDFLFCSFLGQCPDLCLSHLLCRWPLFNIA